jgi:UV DNA damage repair endonuclease
MLYELVHTKIGIPIVFDHITSTMVLKTKLWKKLQIWLFQPGNTKALTHMSSARKIEDEKSLVTRYMPDYIYEKIETFGLDFDVEIEAKSKDLAVFKYKRDLNSLI